MSPSPSIQSDLAPLLALMQEEGLSAPAQASFARQYQILRESPDAFISEETLGEVGELPQAVALSAPMEGLDALFDQSVLIKLNGGLGTGMGLEAPKSLLQVREGKTFLDLIVAQLEQFATLHGKRPRFLLMNSFSTSAQTSAYLAENHPQLDLTESWELLQSKAPKILADSFQAASLPDQPELCWCPPGHGDIYTSLVASGMLEKLLAEGVRYAFVSNSDNLGATLSPALLHWFAHSGKPFAMEVTRRTAADKKGGHLARRAADGQLILRESAQCAPADKDAFQDIETHRYFNTNNLWINLEALQEQIKAHEGVLPLPVISNAKPLNPRDPESPAVIQLETAMGSAIECFAEAVAIEVPRTRFAPVKTCDDLLVLRSDACEIRADGSVGLVAQREGKPPAVSLDKQHYKLIDGFERLIEQGLPSMIACQTLEVKGAWRLENGVEFQGAIKLENQAEKPSMLNSGRYQDQQIKV